MARFIPIDKMKKLREASKNGDEKAKKILSMHLGGTEDFSSLMDEYFAAPQGVTEKPATESDGLTKFLEFNGIQKGHPEYDSYVEDYYKENPQERDSNVPEQNEEDGCCALLEKLLKEETEAINSYSKKITEIMNYPDIEGSKKRKIIARLEEIRSDEQEHFSELSNLLKLCSSEEEI